MGGDFFVGGVALRGLRESLRGSRGRIACFEEPYARFAGRIACFEEPYARFAGTVNENTPQLNYIQLRGMLVICL